MPPILPGQPRGTWTLPLAADTLIRTGPGRLLAVIPNGNANTSFQLFDGLSAAGTLILAQDTAANTAPGTDFTSTGGIPFTVGLFLDMAATPVGRVTVCHEGA